MTADRTATPGPWSPESWRRFPHSQMIDYPDRAELDASVELLRSLPPLVTSWEIERLKSLRCQRYEVAFQRRLTALGQRISRARTEREIEEIEGQLGRLERE